MRAPRNTLHGTLAEGQLTRNFWAAYVNAYLMGGTEEDMGGASFVFLESIVAEFQSLISARALTTPVVFFERLSNNVLAVCIGLRNNSYIIAVNARVNADPEVMAHALVEECVHAEQMMTGVDVAEQRRTFLYQVRPYEVAAKRMATDLLGYEGSGFLTFLHRKEAGGVLLDQLLNGRSQCLYAFPMGVERVTVLSTPKGRLPWQTRSGGC